MQKLPRFICLLALLAVPAIGLSACNTVEGFGQDVETLGEGLEDAGESGYND